MEELIETMKEILKDDNEFISLSAKVTKKTVEALEAEGFTRAEAVTLVVKK